jgi:hypothetical protein
MSKAKINPEFTYKTRDGQKITNLRLNDCNIYPFIAEVEGHSRTYTNRGYYYYADSCICGYDLIKQPVKKSKPAVKEAKKEVMKNASTVEVVQQDQVVPHIHHDMIIAWAKNPKLKVQTKVASATDFYWYETECPEWRNNQEYRFKPEEPKFLTIIGADGKSRSYPEPCKAKPDLGTTYYFPVFAPQRVEFTDWYNWARDETDNMIFDKSFVHLTEKAAEAHAKAMLGID